MVREMEIKADSLGISPLILMENASIGVVNRLKKRFDVKDKKILVVCGRGNNGGDGMAVARHLRNSGAIVNVIVVDGDKAFSKETETNFKILKNLGIPIFLSSEKTKTIDSLFTSSEIIIDALFGTGLTREVKGVYKDLIEKINLSNKYVLSVDIPSGINSDTGEVMESAVKASCTVALGYLKLGHVIFPGRQFIGDIEIVDISLSCEPKSNYFLIDGEETNLLKKRYLNTHKGTYGHLVIIGGSVGKTGAVAMAGKAGLRTGAGLVTIVCPENLNNILEALSLEIMTLPLNGSGYFLDGKLIENMKDFLIDKECIVLGPGMGFNEKTMSFFREVMGIIKSPLVIDADGLNCLAVNKDLLLNSKCDIVLTPHPGEMARLMDKNISIILKNPIDCVSHFAKEYNCHVVLKGSTTIYSEPSGNVYFSTYGNPGMATAGSGDVLSGIIGSFIAQRYGTKEAIILSLLLHGMAGDLAKDNMGEYGLNASDIIEALPMILKKWEVKNAC
jgi:NAD(P)H-hydrate epimerase